MRISIICFSVTDHTHEMASEIANGIEEEGVEARIFRIGEECIDAEYIAASKGVIIGTPTYLASSAWQVQKWLEEDSRQIDLSGKLGGAFATAHFAQGGADGAIMSILGLLLVRGMLVYSGGSSLGRPFVHHGPVALDAVSGHWEESRGMFRTFGSRFAAKAREIFGH